MAEHDGDVRDGGDVPLSQAMGDAMKGFVAELKTFKDDIQCKLQKREDRMTKLEQKITFAGGRPALAGEAQTAPHQKAIDSYLRTGDEDSLRALDLEAKA